MTINSDAEAISLAAVARHKAVKVETLTKFRQDIQPEWDAAVLRLDGTVYMTFDWLRSWWDFYGQGKNLKIFIFRIEGKIVGLIPLWLDRIGFGPLAVWVARLVGANVPPKTFDPPIDAEVAEHIFLRLFEELFSDGKCDVVSLGPVSKVWTGFASLEAAAGLLRARGHEVTYSPRDVRTLFRLPETFEEFLEAMDPSERKGRMKRVRQLEKNHAITEDILADPAAVLREFDRFAARHAEQWQKMGKGGHFEAWPKGLAFNRALTEAQARHGRAKFFRLLADGQVIASRYTFQIGSTLFSELPARATGMPWDKYGIGVTSLLKFKGQCIREGIRMVDSGLGAYEHKSGIGGEEIKVGVWRVTGPKEENKRRAKQAAMAGRAALLLCNKIWYRRMVPRMPKRVSRAQSLSWLRFDF